MKLLGLLVALAACGGSGGSNPEVDAAGDDVDALPKFDCWPTIEPIPRGRAELGSGVDAFQPMPETLPLGYGPQGGFMVMVRTRTSGFLAGGPPLTNPANPFTKPRAFFADTGQSLMIPGGNCASREWYVESTNGDLEVFREIPVIFDTCWRIDRLLGARIRIDLELMDATGSYATDVKTITATDPPPGTPVDETPADCGM
jgi:hypothetical protein